MKVSSGLSLNHSKEQKGIKEVATEFEGMIVGELMKVFRQTIPKNELVNGGFGEEIFTSMLDNAFAQEIAQRGTFKIADMVNKVHFSEKDDYLLWLGRLSKARNKDRSFMDPKGVRWAIKLVQETDSKLILSGNIEDMEFYNRDVKPHLNDKIKWLGPVSSEQLLTKQQVVKLMQKARAFLMTINWYGIAIL